MWPPQDGRHANAENALAFLWAFPLGILAIGLYREGRRDVLLYWLAMNGLGLFLMWLDKQRAIRNREEADWPLDRVPESGLWWTAWLGGALGLWCGMTLFRHKTRKALFRLGLPALALAQIFGLFYLAGHLAVLSAERSWQ